MSTLVIGEDGIIYAESSNGKFYAINPDGTLRWELENASSTPNIEAGGTIYTASDYDDTLCAIYSSAGGLAQSPWPKFHHDVRNSGARIVAAAAGGGGGNGGGG